MSLNSGQFRGQVSMDHRLFWCPIGGHILECHLFHLGALVDAAFKSPVVL